MNFIEWGDTFFKLLSFFCVAARYWENSPEPEEWDEEEDGVDDTHDDVEQAHEDGRQQEHLTLVLV